MQNFYFLTVFSLTLLSFLFSSVPSRAQNASDSVDIYGYTITIYTTGLAESLSEWSHYRPYLKDDFQDSPSVRPTLTELREQISNRKAQYLAYEQKQLRYILDTYLTEDMKARYGATEDHYNHYIFALDEYISGGGNVLFLKHFKDHPDFKAMSKLAKKIHYAEEKAEALLILEHSIAAMIEGHGTAP